MKVVVTQSISLLQKIAMCVRMFIAIFLSPFFWMIHEFLQSADWLLVTLMCYRFVVSRFYAKLQ